MKDIANETTNTEAIEAKTEPVLEAPKKQKIGFTKSGNLLMKIGGIVFGVMILSLLISTFWGASDVNQVNKDTSTVGQIPISSKNVSPEQAAAVKQKELQERDGAVQMQQTYVEEGIFDVTATPTIKPIENGNPTAPVIEGVGATLTPASDNTPAGQDVDIQDPFEHANDASKPTINRRANNSNNTSSGSTLAEIKAQRIQELTENFSANPTFSKKKMKEDSRYAAIREPEITSTTKSGFKGIDMSYEGEDSVNNNQDSNSKKGKGRGLRVGDTLLGKVKNGLNSDTPSQLMLVEIIQPPLKGALIPFKPTLAYDNYVFQSDNINFGEHSSPITAIVVTPNENLSNGYRSDVDYHTLYKLGMIFVSGVAKGTAEYVKTVGGTLAVDGSTVIENNEFDKTRAIIAAGGGVVDAGAQLIQDAINKPPTVTVNVNDPVGVMIIGDFNPEWFPFIPKHKSTL